MYFYDCLVVVNRDRVLFHNDTNLLSFFEFCHTSMPGGATLFSKTWLTKQKHDGMTFGEWGDQASSEGPHKLFCECCKKHLTCGNWGTTSILQHIMKPGHILNHKDRTDTSQKRFILSISAHSRHSIQKPQAERCISSVLLQQRPHWAPPPKCA